MLKIIWTLFLLMSLHSFAQSNVKSFFELSSPERCWVICHPFKAKKALKISNETLIVTDSIANVKRLDKDLNGSRIDAFKHSYWMARLTQDIGKKKALKLGKAHEKGNYRTFKKNQLEDGFHPDKPSSEMDLFNNEIGAQVGSERPDYQKDELIELIITEIDQGKMKVLKKDPSGNFLSCDGLIIPDETLFGKWDNNKCLIFSIEK